MSTSSACPAGTPCALCYESHHRYASSSQGVWSEEEHDRFLDAMKLFPNGPWKDITAHIGTRSVRQVQTHAQKYCEKLERRTRGLQKERKRLLRPEHRLDHESYLGVCSAPNALDFDAAGAIAYERERVQPEPQQECPSISPRSDSERAHYRSEGSGDDDANGLFSVIDLDEQCLAYLACVLGVDDEGGHV